MAAASGIAAIVAAAGSVERRFTALGDSFAVNDDIEDEFTVDGNTITWDGANPEMQNTSGSPKTVTSLAIYTAPAAGLLMAVIPHSPVILENNETIGYALVEVTFNTADP